MTRDRLKEENLVARESKKATDSIEELSYKSSTTSSDKISKRRRNPRLEFTEEELSDSRLEKAIKRVNKAENELDKALDKRLTKYKLQKEIIYDEGLHKRKTRLKFEEVDALPKRKGRLRHPAQTITNTADNVLHAKIYEVEKDNVGVEAGHGAKMVAEEGVRLGSRKLYGAYRNHRMKAYRNIDKAEKNVAKAQINFQRQKMMKDNPVFATNLLSRFLQKQQLKRRYAKELREASKTDTSIAFRLSAFTNNTTKKVGQFVRRHYKGVLNHSCFLIVMSIGGGITSCSSMMTGGMNSILASSYTAEDSDITSVESDYLTKESSLRNRLKNIESEYEGYDEYRYDLDEIGHNPYELAAYLTI